MTGEDDKKLLKEVMEKPRTVLQYGEHQLYNISLEMAMENPAHIRSDERKHIRWSMPDDEEGNRTVSLTYRIADKTHSNYVTVQSTALVKGLSMFNHRFGYGMIELGRMEDEALDNEGSDYYRRRRNHAIKLVFPNNKRQLYTDEITYNEIKRLAKLLHMEDSQFNTILVLYGLSDSDSIPGYLKRMYQKYIDGFETSIRELFESVGIKTDAQHNTTTEH